MKSQVWAKQMFLWSKLQTLPAREQALVLCRIWGSINYTQHVSAMSAEQRAAQKVFLAAADSAIAKFVTGGDAIA